LRFQDERVKKFWEKTLASFKRGKKGDKDKLQRKVDEQQADRASNPIKAERELLEDGAPELEDDDQPSEQDNKPGKFDVLPGLDDVRLKNDISDPSIVLAA